jgi:hypothetical protein
MRLEDEINDEDRAHGMDNRFSMADVTLNKSIPYVRELTNSVGYSQLKLTLGPPRYPTLHVPASAEDD